MFSPSSVGKDQARRCDAALKAVRDASLVCRRVQQQSCADARLKGDRSPVTIADFASQAVIVHSLERALGPVAIVGEEDAEFMASLGDEYLDSVVSAVRSVWPDATGRSVREAIAAGCGSPGASGFWTLDPIDGTKGFLRGEQYAVALAYIEDGRPTVGVLGCPNLSADPCSAAATVGGGILCFAVEGHGAFEIPIDEAIPPRRLVASALQGTNQLCLCASVEHAHGDPSGVAAIVAHARVETRSVSLDSQCKYAVVARAQADAYLRVPPSAVYREWIWDHAAGSLIATEAGCTVTDLAGRRLDFAQGRRLDANRGILCATPEAHTTLLRAIDAAGLSDHAAEHARAIPL